jgi:hypothetical protein
MPQTMKPSRRKEYRLVDRNRLIVVADPSPELIAVGLSDGGQGNAFAVHQVRDEWVLYQGARKPPKSVEWVLLEEVPP